MKQNRARDEEHLWKKIFSTLFFFDEERKKIYEGKISTENCKCSYKENMRITGLSVPAIYKLKVNIQNAYWWDRIKHKKGMKNQEISLYFYGILGQCGQESWIFRRVRDNLKVPSTFPKFNQVSNHFSSLSFCYLSSV